ncbi:G0/G1 switch protein 2-like [Cheilinus undulatus]|uniref:G0/G1 switch protein 2-like n=1 Tax=Cheilinus undulatus TaxID=241271 RepID=UPI001BD4DA77|nr:G0/G1 switch protein 2-like [Cheilinus undulatus]
MSQTRENTHQLYHSLPYIFRPSLHALEAEPLEMESLQELIPFAKEMLSQKPNRGLLKVYLVGSVFAVLGTVIGLVGAVCQPFCPGEQMDAEMILMLAREQRTVESALQQRVEGKEEEEEEEKEEELATIQNKTHSKTHSLSQRNISNRLHAS